MVAVNILLIDDDQEVLESIGGFLAVRGHGLRTATSGLEALKRMETDIPDLVLCDIRMPGINGLLFLQAARTRFPETPIVLMCGDWDANAALATFRSGAYDYLRKPIGIRELTACIERVAAHTQD